MASARRHYRAIDTAVGQLADRPVLTIFGARNDTLRFQPQWKQRFLTAEQIEIPKGYRSPMCDNPDLVVNTISQWHSRHSARTMRDLPREGDTVTGLTSESQQLDSSGFVVLRGYFDPEPLTAEFDAAMAAAFEDPNHSNVGSIGNLFRYVPMMCERTPISVGLLVALADVAAQLLGAPVLPGRAKGTAYLGAANWHRDSTLAIRSVGCVAYLEPLDSETGALRILPGSHRGTGDARLGEAPAEITAGETIATAPGDVIVFDERTLHASRGGVWRRQWRTDFIAEATTDNDSGHDQMLRSYYAAQHAPGWDGGYDVDAFPSYGSFWRSVNPKWNKRLTSLGAYTAAETEEQHARATRSTKTIAT